MSKYKVGSPEFIEEAKKLGLTPWQYGQKLIKEGRLPNPADIQYEEHNKTAINAGFANRSEYRDFCMKNRGFSNNTECADHLVRKRGYKDISEYARECRWNKGICSPMSENEDCSLYLGIYIAERSIAKKILPIILGDIENEMPPNYPGYDFIIKGGIKVDIKSARLNNEKNCYHFSILYNDKAHYFLLIAFDNQENYNPVHIWLIEKNEMIRKGIGGGYIIEKFYNRCGIEIYDNIDSRLSSLYFQKYDHIDKLII